MRIVQLERTPVDSIPFLNASRRGGTDTESLPILLGRLDTLPEQLDALLIASDLQGVIPDWRAGGEPRLLGEQLVDFYVKLYEEGRVPSPSRTAVILAGDLYSSPDAAVRGASGDVRVVWRAFAGMFRWVAGVAGNHDRFGTARDERKLRSQPGVYLLDGEIVDIDGLRVAGVGLVTGDPQNPGKREESQFLALLQRVVEQKPDLLILHESPRGSNRQPGSPVLREELERTEVALIVCGHKHWAEPVLELRRQQQIVNVNTRAIVMSAGG
jgi:Icc-related predicted phosphoesterase